MTRHVACDDATIIPSLDGVSIVMHDFGGTGSPVLLSHATGFHGHCMEGIAALLRDDHHTMAFDHRGYGDADAIDSRDMEWRAYGHDALAAARHLSNAHDGAPVVGIGHSMGGASLIMAAHAAPDLFRALFVFEPIVFPPVLDDSRGGERPTSPLPALTRKRKPHFDSFEDALANFTAKPPMNTFDPAVREAYVRHGFRPAPQGGVELKCSPEHEARTYETGGTSGAWDDLPDVRTPTWVVSGAPQQHQPSSFARNVAERMPHATYVQYDELGHFGPLEVPRVIADLVTFTLASMK